MYTDGSCHTQLLTGAWAALILFGEQRIVVKGTEEKTTHNRMEIKAVLEGLRYLDSRKIIAESIEVYSDSQYVVELPRRQKKISEKNYCTNAGKIMQNADLVQMFYEGIGGKNVKFIKVKAH